MYGEVLKSPHIPYVFEQYMKYFSRGLRDQIQVMRIIEAALLNLKNEPIHLHFLFFLAALYQRSPTIYREILNRKSFSNAPGFEKLQLNAADGKFFAPKFSEEPFGRRVEQKIVTVREVVGVYLSAVSKTYEELNLHEIHFDDFPKNLLLSLKTNPPPGNDYVPALGKYFEIVRHAGGFASAAKIP